MSGQAVEGWEGRRVTKREWRKGREGADEGETVGRAQLRYLSRGPSEFLVAPLAEHRPSARAEAIV